MQSKIMERAIKALEINLENLDEKNAEKYFFDSVKSGFAGMILGWLVWNLLFDFSLSGILFSALSGCLVFYYFYIKPKKRIEKRIKRIEKELPFALMQVSVDISTGNSFDRALGKIGEGYGELSTEIDKCLRKAKKTGKTEVFALKELSRRNNSKLLRRSIAQLISVYYSGNEVKGEGIRNIAKEILSRQKAEVREFSGKIVMFSLVFIVVSSIVPALFQAFLIIGSSFMEIPFSGIEALAIIILLFPLCDAIIFLLIREKTPEMLKG